MQAMLKAVRSVAGKGAELGKGAGYAALVMMLVSSPAFAQFTAVQSKLTTFQTALVGIGATVATLAVLFAGFKMMFQQAKWAEISHICIGGVLVGAAVALGTWLTA